MKTKGALVWDLNQPWTIDEIDIGDPRRGEVTVQPPAFPSSAAMRAPESSPIPVKAWSTWPWEITW